MVYVIQFWDCGHMPPALPEVTNESEPLTSTPPCKPELWRATYGAMSRFGILKTNPTSLYDRHALTHRCVVNVHGIIRKIHAERDGDVKIMLALDASNYPPFGSYPENMLINEHNLNKWLTVEIVCAATPKPRGTGKDPKTISQTNPQGLDWKWPGIMSPVSDSQNDGAVVACRNYTNHIEWASLKNSDEIMVTGELIKDTGPEANKDPATMAATPLKLGHGNMEIHPVTTLTKLW